MSDNLYNINMERAVLSAVIFDPEIFEGVMVKLKPKISIYHFTKTYSMRWRSY